MAKVTQLPIEIPKGLKVSQRKAIADLVIEFMVDRTMDGKDKDGKRFPKYSKPYTESLDFKNAGKSSKVNLQLSGDMLAALTLVEHEDGKLLIGYEDGADEEGRAEGNILGSYGGEPNPRKARDFLGIKPRNLKRIIDLVVSGE